MPSNAAIALVLAGAGTAALFVLDRFFDHRPGPSVYPLPVRRRRSDTPAILFERDADLRRRLGSAT
ncbi:MAG TPA: hypothetical protein VGK73_32525 [Polyangiaceae bacterium]